MKFLLAIVVIAISAATLAAIFLVKRDGGLMCSIDHRFMYDARLAQVNNFHPGYPGELELSFTHNDNLTGTLNSESRPWEHLDRVESGINIQNVGSQAIAVTLAMEMESEGVTWTPINLQHHFDGKLEYHDQETLSFEIAAGARQRVVFHFDYTLFDKKLQQQSLKQTVFIGETTPKEILVSQQLTRVKRAYNCLGFGGGHPYKPG